MRIGGIIFLSVMIAYVLRPIYPYIDYVLNKDYVVNFLCVNKDKPELKCNGKCHLNKELINQAKEDKKPLTPYSNRVLEILLLWFRSPDITYLSDRMLSSENSFFDYPNIYSFLKHYFFFHPPD